MPDRRHFLRVSGAAALGSAVVGCVRERSEPDLSHFERPQQSRVAVLRHERYDHTLGETLLRGLRLFKLDLGGRRVLLKPNLVEFDPEGVINTHPAVIAATIEAFRRLGASDVIVGEGPGHRRDNEYLLEASGLGYILRDAGARYVDLNTDAVRPLKLPTNFSGLGSLYLPDSVLDADLVVSMPKLKTHKWAGVTLSMKNMFGIVPGSVYGWPKNVLHWHGVSRSIVDINALSLPRFNIVDGIVGMEGNGPIQGDARQSGILILGADPVAVDATAARLMGVDPLKVDYIAGASQFLGNAEAEHLEHLGEPIEPYTQAYRLHERHSHIAL